MTEMQFTAGFQAGGPPTLGDVLLFAERDKRTDEEAAMDFARGVRRHDGGPLTEAQERDMATAYRLYLDATDQDSVRYAYDRCGQSPEQVTFTVPGCSWWALELWVPGWLADVICGPKEAKNDA